ncbi:hypothetical protein ACQ0QQ_01010 [Lysinibacillus sphaericus]
MIPFITAIDFRAKLRFPRAVGEPPRLRLRVRKAEGLWSEAGGIRRIDHEGVLCLLGRVDLCHVPLSPGAGQVSPNTLFPQESTFCTPINRWKQLNIYQSLKLKPELIYLLEDKSGQVSNYSEKLLTQQLQDHLKIPFQ